MSKKDKVYFFVPLLFIIYMVLLIWIIVFKLQISYSELDTIRSINVIPFYYDNGIGVRFHLTEVLENIAIFIPFGIYLCMLKRELRFPIKLMIILGTSLALEIIQFILAIGSSDITDLLTNTCGGILGIIIYSMFVRAFRSRKRANKVIMVAATIATVFVIAGLAVLLIAN